MEERLTQIRKYFHLSMEQFGEKLGVTKATVSRMESGVTGITTQTINTICREFDVDENWFRTGEGEMFREMDLEAEIAKLTHEILTEDSESFKTMIIKALAELPPEGWKALETTAREMLNTKALKKLTKKED